MKARSECPTDRQANTEFAGTTRCPSVTRQPLSQNRTADTTVEPPSVVNSSRAMAGATDLVAPTTPDGDDANSATGRTGTFSMDDFWTTLLCQPPATATTPRESAAPTRPATKATPQMLTGRRSPPVVVPATTFSTGPSSDGWRHSRSSGGRGAPKTGASSSLSSSGGTAENDTDGLRPRG